MSGVLGVNRGSATARSVRNQRAKFVASQVRRCLLDLSSSHPYPSLMLIIPSECDAGLRRKRVYANVRPFSVTSAFAQNRCTSHSSGFAHFHSEIDYLHAHCLALIHDSMIVNEFNT